MGFFVYDNQEFEVDDRTLAHLQVVIIDKLRRNEAFGMNLADGSRLITVWMSPRSRLQFVFVGNRHPTLNRGWLNKLSDNVGMTGMLNLLSEPAEDWAPTLTTDRPRELATVDTIPRR
jgi:hypothetical protein